MRDVTPSPGGVQRATVGRCFNCQRLGEFRAARFPLAIVDGGGSSWDRASSNRSKKLVADPARSALVWLRIRPGLGLRTHKSGRPRRKLCRLTPAGSSPTLLRAFVYRHGYHTLCCRVQEKAPRAGPFPADRGACGASAVRGRSSRWCVAPSFRGQVSAAGRLNRPPAPPLRGVPPCALVRTGSGSGAL